MTCDATHLSSSQFCRPRMPRFRIGAASRHHAAIVSCDLPFPTRIRSHRLHRHPNPGIHRSCRLQVGGVFVQCSPLPFVADVARISAARQEVLIDSDRVLESLGPKRCSSSRPDTNRRGVVGQKKTKILLTHGGVKVLAMVGGACLEWCIAQVVVA